MIGVLCLNPMRGNTEDLCAVAWARADTTDAVVAKLKAWEASHRAPEPYREKGPHSFDHTVEHTWYKVFAKGGPLEWMNPLGDVSGRIEFVPDPDDPRDTATILNNWRAHLDHILPVPQAF